MLPANATDPALQALVQLDGLLSVQLTATLAGLSLATATFLLSGPLQELKTLAMSAFEIRYGHGADGHARYRRDVDDLERGGRNLFRAFLSFLLSSVIALALVDTSLESFLATQAGLEIADVVSSGTPFVAGLGFLFDGARRIKQYYLRPVPRDNF